MLLLLHLNDSFVRSPDITYPLLHSWRNFILLLLWGWERRGLRLHSANIARSINSYKSCRRSFWKVLHWNGVSISQENLTSRICSLFLFRSVNFGKLNSQIRTIRPTECTIYFQFISINNLHMFRAGLLLIIRRYYSVYTAFSMCHAFMLTGCWQDPDPANSQSTRTNCCIYTVVPPDDEQ